MRIELFMCFFHLLLSYRISDYSKRVKVWRSRFSSAGDFATELEDSTEALLVF